MNIKFRVVLKDSGGHISVDYYDLTNISNIYQQSVFEVVAVNLSTNLKDKNDKEIYEGDIVTENRELIYQVIWCDDKFRLGFRLKSINGDGLLYSFEEVFGYGERGEIIGNIYDNPDLLKESSN